MSIRYGTPYYESRAAAENAYGLQGAKIAIDEGRIFIGKPYLEPGQVLLIHKDERRYFIEDTNDDGLNGLDATSIGFDEEIDDN